MSTRTPTKFTPELTARIRKVHADNPDVSIKDLASRFGCSAHALTRIIKGEEPRNSTASARLSPETIAEVLRRFAAGETAEWIGRSLGLHPRRAQRIKERDQLRRMNAEVMP